MKLYRIEVAICATAYVKATTKAEAAEKARALGGRALAVENAAHGTDTMTPISGVMFSDSRLPEVSLSPAMTILGMSGSTVELVAG